MFYIKFGTTEAEEQCIKYKKQNDSHHEDPIKRNVKSTWMDRVFLKRPTSNLISFVSKILLEQYNTLSFLVDIMSKLELFNHAAFLPSYLSSLFSIPINIVICICRRHFI